MKYFLSAVAMIALIVSSGTAGAGHSGRNCSTGDVRGSYVFTCEGAAAPFGDPSVGLLPASGLGTATFDGAGGVLGGEVDVSIGGVLIQQVITGGVGTVNADCTATVELDVSVGGMDLPPLSMTGAVLDRGDRILAFSRVPGTSAVCRLERLSRTASHANRGDGDDDDDDD